MFDQATGSEGNPFLEPFDVGPAAAAAPASAAPFDEFDAILLGAAIPYDSDDEVTPSAQH